MNFNDEIIEKFGLVLALCSLDDKISVQKSCLPEQDNRSIYIIKYSDNHTSFEYSISPEHLHADEISQMLTSILVIEAKDILGKNINSEQLNSYNSQISLASNIINGKKDFLLKKYDSYMSYSTSERRNCMERKILDNYLQTIEDFSYTFYFNNPVDYKTNEYKVTEVMYSIMSLVSGEDSSIDIDTLSHKVNPDLITAESHKAIKASEKDYDNGLKLNNIMSKSKTPKMDLRDLNLSLDEEISLVCKYKQLGLLSGVVFKSSDGQEIPLDDYVDEDENASSGQELSFEDTMEYLGLDDMTNDEFDDATCDDGAEIDDEDGDVFGVIYKNEDAGENEISQITISPIALKMIDKCSGEKSQNLSPIFLDIIDDLFKKSDFIKNFYNHLFNPLEDILDKNDQNTQNPDDNQNKPDNNSFNSDDDFDDGKDL